MKPAGPPDRPPDIFTRLKAAGARLLVAAVEWAGAPDLTPGPRLDATEIATRNHHNRRQTLFLSSGMATLLFCAAALLAGWWGIFLVAASLAGMIALGPRISPDSVMETYGGEAVEPRNGRAFLGLVAELARRAELANPPVLYVIPSATLNAFAVGTRDRSAIAITEGLIRRLQMRELAGVLAHEISHIRNGDLWIMGLADGMTRITRILSLSALALMALNLVSLFTGVSGLSWTGLLLLYLTPLASSSMQQALSRTRELDADLDGVTLTGDAQGLAVALAKLDPQKGRPWEDLVYGMRRVPQPSLLRSHPTTAERLEHLRAVTAAGPGSVEKWPRLVVVDAPMITARAGVGASAMEPRYRWMAGVWY
jgi:heat shock protein HtpX